MLTTNHILKLTKLPSQTLYNYVNNGHLKPAFIGTKKTGHRFTFMQGVGLAVAARIMRSDQSSTPTYFASVVRAFERLTPDYLVGRFESGDCYLMAVVKDRLLLSRHDEAGWPDCRECYELARQEWLEATVGIAVGA